MLKPLGKEDGDSNEKKGAPFKIDATSSLVINAAVTLVLLLIFTVIIYSLLGGMIDKKLSSISIGSGEGGVEDTIETEVDERGIVLDLGDFILNLSDSSPRRFLKINVAIELSRTEEETARLHAPPPKGGGGHGAPAAHDPMTDIIAEMEQYKPAIRDAVITILTSKTSDELSTTTGKELAKEEIQDLVSSIFSGAREVLRVSFGQFVIQ